MAPTYVGLFYFPSFSPLSYCKTHYCFFSLIFTSSKINLFSFLYK
ncbi:hypothetical protein HMPREF0083_02065 [Aneurinibacillus aneurinilyticus ATCC 12856]|uniref:Uncharacterized protein n=1 Tax=Aneurinibacillus aneurinilyticus ATCC 12856 TaxID=649747 RepID=U1YCJ8_ANEAE|nr:hypothetical protein HMPREF0083_02065 [Aneurinibacillus aneurinilyticus ATCC 12856]